MWPIKIIVEWCAAAALLYLSSTLLFCGALRGLLQPTICHRLQGYVWRAARPLIDLFGG
ncbi:MAG: hypothetical protein HYV61_00440 [Candidatus Rokubacteria bacterium]|nr:hypothetical protein [Candidatus Rokubacteria bacterium]